MFVPARLGLGRAFVMALLADRVRAAEAVGWGLADRLVPDDDLAAVAEQLLLRLADGPTRSYAATKRLINQAQLAALPATLDAEASEQSQLLFTDDFDHAVTAFGAKQPGPLHRPLTGRYRA